MDSLLAGPLVEHYHQAVAIVVAETFEQARDAGELIKVDYTETKGAFSLKDGMATSEEPDPKISWAFPSTDTGDFDGAFAAAPVKRDQTDTTLGNENLSNKLHRDNHNFKRFMLRGINKVNVETGLLALAHNLRKKVA